MRMNEEIAIIIPTKNRPQDVARCLNSIKNQTILPHEVVIVDSSDVDTLKSIQDIFPGLKIRYLREWNASKNRARNIGIESASAQIVLILDDDVILEKDHVKEIMRVFALGAERTGGVTGRLVRSPELKTPFLRVRVIVRRIFARAFLLTRARAVDEREGRFYPSGRLQIIKDSNRIIPCEFLAGADMAFRREIAKEFRFDENMRGYSWGDDDDFSYRLSRKYTNFYTPHARYIHVERGLTEIEPEAYARLSIEGHYYFYDKNLPKDFKHKFAFWWSVFGCFLSTLAMTLVTRRAGRLRGLTRGLIAARSKRAKGWTG